MSFYEAKHYVFGKATITNERFGCLLLFFENCTVNIKKSTITK